MKTVIAKCKCHNQYQDTVYGKGFRVMNPTMKTATKGNRQYRCTVCTSLHQLSDQG